MNHAVVHLFFSCYPVRHMWILTLILFVFLLSLAYASASGAPWVPTWKKDLERILKLVDVKDGETFVELGCGNGRVCRYVAARSNAKVIGVELSLLQFCIAWLQAKASGLKNIEIRFGNAFHYDLKDVDVLYMFLMPETYEKIRPKLESELSGGAGSGSAGKPGSRVVTYVWPIAGWEPTKIDEVEGSQKIYLYQR